LENKKQASLWISDHRLTHPVIPDPDGILYRKYGSGSVPYHVLIDGEFKITLSQEEFDKDRLIGLIQDSLGKLKTE
jgi:hypothetical protein